MTTEATPAAPMWTPRPKGYAPWKPHRATLQLMEQVQAVLDEYKAYLPLTLRQIFYRLVGAYDYPKTEKDYKRLGEYLVRARRAQMIPFSAIRDDGTRSQGGAGWDDFAEFLRAEQDSAEGYVRDRMAGQPVRIELWCEATGMLPQLSRVAGPFHITCHSTALGFSSITTTRQIAERALRAGTPTTDDDGNEVAGIPSLFMHVGDYDPSGESIYNAMAEDAGAFVEQLREGRDAAHAEIRPLRVALTEQQVSEYELPTAPPKASDTRSRNWEGETCQAEAMPPDVLAKVLKDTIVANIDKQTRDDILTLEATERAAAVRMVSAMLHAQDPTVYPFEYSGVLGGYFDTDDE